MTRVAVLERRLDEVRLDDLVIVADFGRGEAFVERTGVVALALADAKIRGRGTARPDSLIAALRLAGGSSALFSPRTPCV